MKIKKESEQLKSNAIRERIANLESELKAVLVEIKKATEAETKKNLVEKENQIYKKLNRANGQLHDYFISCTDYEIDPCVNTDMVDFYFANLFPQNSYVRTMIKDKVGHTHKMMDSKILAKRAANLLSLDFNTYCSPANFSHVPVFESQRNLPYGTDKNSVPKSGTSYRGGVKETVISTQAIVVDCDYRDTVYSGLLADDLYNEIKDNGDFDVVGEPSFCVVSSEGQGLQMVYLLDNPFYFAGQDKNIKRYEDVIKSMVDNLSAYGADKACVDVTHIFRIPCSYNIRSASWGFLLHWEILKDCDYDVTRYSYKNLEDATRAQRGLSPIPAKQAKTETKEATITAVTAKTVVTPVTTNIKKHKDSVIVTDAYGLAQNRCNDLDRLINLRGRNIDGYRNPILFVYASQYALMVNNDINDILAKLTQINNLFPTPKPAKEIEILAKRFSKKSYKYKDSTIVNTLDITDDEIKSLQVIGNSGISKNAKKAVRRNAKRHTDGVLKTKVSKKERDNQIKALRANGLTNKQIMQAMDISVDTIKRAFKQ